MAINQKIWHLSCCVTIATAMKLAGFGNTSPSKTPLYDSGPLLNLPTKFNEFSESKDDLLYCENASFSPKSGQSLTL